MSRSSNSIRANEISPKGYVPKAFATGYGPSFSALIAELSGVAGNNRDMVQSFCNSVLGISISLGALPSTMWMRKPHGKWVEPILPVRYACRLRKRSTFEVLTEVLDCYFKDQNPDIDWLKAVRA